MASGAPAVPRLASVDALRGVTVAGMILVNTAGGVAASLGVPPLTILEHSHWAGLTLADVVFPAFITIMGVSIVLAHRGAVVSAAHRGSEFVVAGRCLRLFVLGFLLTNLGWLADFDSAPWRLFGVLQRIGLTYLACGLLQIWMTSRARLILAAAILLLYWPLCLLPTLDGVPVDLAERGMNFIASVDRWLLGPGEHNYVKGPLGYDPEGLLSTLPCIAQGLIGMTLGEYLICKRGDVLPLAIAGVTMALAGLAWGNAFPVVKDLWTSSYVLLTSGLTALALAIGHRFLDGEVAGSFLRRAVLLLTVPFGINAILIYVLYYLLDPLLYWQVMRHPFSLLVPWTGPQIASLAPSLIFIAMLWLIAFYMARRRWLVKI